jgi:hypothetical protein
MWTVKEHRWTTHNNTQISVLDQFVILWHMHEFYVSRCCTEGTMLSCDSVHSANIQTNMSTVKVHYWSTHSNTQISVLDQFLISWYMHVSTFLHVVTNVPSYPTTRYKVPTYKPTCRLEMYTICERIATLTFWYLTNLWYHGICMTLTFHHVVPKYLAILRLGTMCQHTNRHVDCKSTPLDHA